MGARQPCLDPRCTGDLWHYDEETNTAVEPCPVNNPNYKTHEERLAAKAEENEKKKPTPGQSWWSRDRGDD